MKTLLVVFMLGATSALSLSTAQTGSPPADRQVYEDAIENHGLRGSADLNANMDEATFGLVLMEYARLLFEAGEKDEAVFWHYAGQLRYRLYASQVPERGGEFFGGFPRLSAALGRLRSADGRGRRRQPLRLLRRAGVRGDA